MLKKNRVIGTLRGFIQTVFRIVLNLGYFYWQSVAKNLVSKMSPEDGKVRKIQLKTFVGNEIKESAMFRNFTFYFIKST